MLTLFCSSTARTPLRSGRNDRAGDRTTCTVMPRARASSTKRLLGDSTTAAIATDIPIAEWPRASERTTVSSPPESAGARTWRIDSGAVVTIEVVILRESRCTATHSAVPSDRGRSVQRPVSGRFLNHVLVLRNQPDRPTMQLPEHPDLRAQRDDARDRDP